MNNILLIGGTGYIGSRLFDFLSQRNCAVDTVDDEWFGNYVNPHNFKIDFKHLSGKMLKKYDAIVLLAANASVKACEDRMLGTFKNHVDNFVSLLDKIGKEQKFVYMSSSSVYGSSELDLCDEECKIYKPNNFYDTTKLHIDDYAKLSGNNYYGLRLGTVNGFSKNQRIDIMINAMLYNATNKGEVTLFNSSIRRPILYIDDLCRAIEKIINSKTNYPGIYNLASFNSTSGDIAASVSDILKVPIKNYDNLDKPENSQVQAKTYDFAIDCSKFEKIYDFEFEGTVDKIIKDLKNNYHLCNFTKRVEAIDYE